MPGPPTLDRRPVRHRRGVVMMVLVLGTATGLGACTTSPDAGSPAGDRGASAASATSGGPSTASQDALAVTALLHRRAAAVVTGDAAAFGTTVADPTTESGRRQLDSFAAARALQVSRLEIGTPVIETVATVGTEPGTGGTPGGSAGPTSPQRLTAQVDLRYRIDDLDRGDRVARLTYELVRSGVGWRVESERPVGAGATAPWVAMPALRVRRGEHAVVAGTVPAARLAEHAGVVDRALPALREQWAGTPARVLVLAPSSAGEADALLGRPTGSGAAPVAATTEGPTGVAGTATGDRVVLDPTAFGRLTVGGRDVVLTHELVHVAVRSTVEGRPAAWLAEGYADHVGYARADVATERLVAPLVSALRTGRAPRELPKASDFQPASGELEVPYLAAWQAVELIAQEHGEVALRRLVAAGSSTGSDSDAEAATDRALVSELDTTRAALTARWLTRLGDLATNPG